MKSKVSYLKITFFFVRHDFMLDIKLLLTRSSWKYMRLEFTLLEIVLSLN